MMAVTSEDAMFDLELRIEDGVNDPTGTVATTNVTWTCTGNCTNGSCNCTVTCYTRYANGDGSGTAPSMCNT